MEIKLIAKSGILVPRCPHKYGKQQCDGFKHLPGISLDRLAEIRTKQLVIKESYTFSCGHTHSISVES